jgi:hypothetical protein
LTIRATTVISPNLKVGLTNWAELDVLMPLYNTVTVCPWTAGAWPVLKGSGS